jgi:predicted AlkP superfamily phosphohydrolase/phosphomutase
MQGNIRETEKNDKSFYVLYHFDPDNDFAIKDVHVHCSRAPSHEK